MEAERRRAVKKKVTRTSAIRHRPGRIAPRQSLVKRPHGRAFLILVIKITGDSSPGALARAQRCAAPLAEGPFHSRPQKKNGGEGEVISSGEKEKGECGGNSIGPLSGGRG